MKSFLLFFAIILFSAGVNAKDYMASSPEEATAFLLKALAGDKIILKDGIYKDAIIRFHNTNGLKEKEITFTAETPGKVLFEGNSYLAFSGNYINISGFTWQNGGDGLGTRGVIEFRTASDKLANFSTLSDCAIINYNSGKSIDNKWVGLHGEYNTVARCLFKDKNNLGATVTVWLTPGKEAHHTISHNYFYGRQNAAQADNGLESLRIGDSKTSFENSHCIVALNLFEECNGEIEIISNKSFHNSYLHNSFVKNDGGLTLRHGNNCLAEGNYFDGTGKKKAYGVRFIGEGHVATNNYFYNLNGAGNDQFRAPVTFVTGLLNGPINGYFQVKRAVVSNNTFVNCATPNIRLGATPKRDGAILAPDSILIQDNFFIDKIGISGDVYQEVKPGKNVIIQNNKVISKKMSASNAGFIMLRDEATLKNNKRKLENDHHAPLHFDYSTAGANWIPANIIAEINKRKDISLPVTRVGPLWMQ